MNLNLQIIPCPDQVPNGAKRVLIPARQGQDGVGDTCPACGGEGRWREGPCRKCRGTGRGQWIAALRWDVSPSEYVAAMTVLRGLPPGARVQQTIRLAETGGGMSNTGHATIVAGLNGEPLRAMCGLSKSLAAHATFFVHAALFVRYARHANVGSGTVSLVGVDRDPDRLGIVSTELWSFHTAWHEIEVVEAIEQGHRSKCAYPAAAVDAAIRKARDYHCRRAYYVADTSTVGVDVQQDRTVEHEVRWATDQEATE